MLALEKRAQGADRAAAEGIMSSQAIIDLYSQIYSHELPNGGPVDTAALSREAILAKQSRRFSHCSVSGVMIQKRDTVVTY